MILWTDNSISLESAPECGCLYFLFLLNRLIRFLLYIACYKGRIGVLSTLFASLITRGSRRHSSICLPGIEWYTEALTADVFCSSLVVFRITAANRLECVRHHVCLSHCLIRPLEPLCAILCSEKAQAEAMWFILIVLILVIRLTFILPCHAAALSAKACHTGI